MMFDLDPWESARRYYEKRQMLFMIRLMRRFGVSQVEVPNYDVDAKGEVSWQDVPERNATLYRIKGHFELAARPEERRSEEYETCPECNLLMPVGSKQDDCCIGTCPRMSK